MIYRSPLPPIDIPDLSYPAYGLSRAGEFGDRAAFIDASTGRALSYADLALHVDRVAGAFSARGMKQGDVLAICLPNLPEFAVAVYAATTLGAIVTTVNPLYTAVELAEQLRDADAKYLLTLGALLDAYRGAVAGSGLAEVFVLDRADGATGWAALLQQGGSVPAVSIDPATDIAALPYSSGTTGMPKGVLLTHRSLVANATMILNGPNELAEGEVFACVPPMFHIYGITMYLGAAMQVGGTVVCMPRFDFEDYVKVIERYRATFAVVVPPVAPGLARHPIVDRHDLSSLRTIVSSAAPLAPALAQAMEARIGARVIQGFGMTEIAGASHTQRKGDPPESVGIALPNVEWTVVDVGSGEMVPPGKQGEVWVRAPSLMAGYLNQPGATAATLDAEGWLHTGDIGYADAEGRCFLVDRLKELIKFKGYQVAPAELEALLLTHPNVADVGVVPIPDVEAGEVPKAFVVKTGEVDAATLQEFVAERVAPYKKIRAIEFVESLPKSPAGKLLRRVLKERG
jgi:acyl-CoA synthetase (AMP-forming)/AMP-acid ligase II